MAARWRALRSGDRVAIVLIVVLPILTYAVPAMLGHPVLPGDDGSQNFPMRVLVGEQLRAGHLPLLDQRIWSGAPLLGGWNAGAAYPFTWLFVVLPGTVAWVIGQMLVPWAAAGGLYGLLRLERLAPFPAALGALVFADSGAMAAQVVHFGLVAGVSWVPLVLVGVTQCARASTRARRCRWATLAGLAAALVVLAGEPRAVDVAVAVVVPIALWAVLRAGPGWWAVAGTLALAGAAAIGVGALQLLPGLHAVADSQRATASYHLFDSGSYPLSWLLLLFEPNLLGGSGSFGAPSFLAGYNLTEVTGYVGVLPWVAAGALLAQLRRRPAPDWAVWYVVGAIGLVLALGGSTPAWHLLIHVPLYGAQRLQSRSIVVVDLALSVLLAVWVDQWVGRPVPLRGTRMDRRVRWERRLGVAGAVAVAATGVTSMVGGAAVLRWLGVSASAAAAGASALRPWFAPTVAVGLAAAIAVAVGHRLDPGRRRRLVGVLVTGDLVCFAVTSLFAIWPSLGHRAVAAPTVATAADPPAGPTVPVADLGIPGRFAVYDPGLVDGPAVHQAGAPDENLVVGGWSLQGYSSVVNGTYAAVTGSHAALGVGQDELSVAAVADGVLDQLDPGALVTPPQFVVVGTGRAVGGQVPGSSDGPDPATGRRRVRAGGTTWWTFGEPVAVRRVTVAVTPSTVSAATATGAPTAPVATGAPGVSTAARASGGAGPATVTVALMGPTGRRTVVRRLVLPRDLAGGGRTGSPSATIAVSLPQAVRAVGLALTSTAPLATGVPVVTAADGIGLALDGVLQAAVTGGQWRYAGQDGPLAVFAATHPVAPLTARPLPTGRGTARAAAKGADRAVPGRTEAVTVQRLAGPALAPTAARVDAPDGAVVVRAVAAISGWSATYTPNGGSPRSVPVHRQGLVQAVTVPAGVGVVRWVYRAPGLRTAAWLAPAGVVVLAGLALGGGVPTRGRGDRPIR